MQCRLSVQMLNICTVICHYIQRRIQKISSNKTKVTNIPFYFPLQHQFLEVFIKAEFNYTNFWSTYSLLFVGFDVVIFLCHSHTPELNPSTVPINYTDYRCSQMQDFSAFLVTVWFIYVVVLFTSSDPTLQLIKTIHILMCTHLYMYHMITRIFKYTNVCMYLCVYIFYCSNKITL